MGAANEGTRARGGKIVSVIHETFLVDKEEVGNQPPRLFSPTFQLLASQLSPLPLEGEEAIGVVAAHRRVGKKNHVT